MKEFMNHVYLTVFNSNVYVFLCGVQVFIVTDCVCSDGSNEMRDNCSTGQVKNGVTEV